MSSVAGSAAGAVPSARPIGDLAALLLCLTAFLSPLMSAESPGTPLMRMLLAAAAALTVLHDGLLGRPWRPSPFLLTALLVWIAGVLAASYGGVHAVGLNQLLVRWSCFALATATAHRLTNDPHRRRLVGGALLIGAVLLSIYGFEEAWLERPTRIAEFDTAPALQSAAAADLRSLAGQERYFNPRIAGGFLSANLMGAAYGLGALLAAGAAWRLWQRLRRATAALVAVAALLQVAALWLTGSKGAMLGLACGAAVALAAAWATGSKRRLHGVAVAGLMGVVLALPVLAAWIPQTHAADFTADGVSTGSLKSAWVRLDYWQTGWRMFRDHPVGIGPDQTQQYFSQYRSPWALETPIDLHHEAFEMLIECGPAALLGMLGVFGWLLAVGLRRVANGSGDPRPAAAAPDLTSTAVAPDTSPTLFLPLPLMAAFALFGGWMLCMTLGFFDMNRQVELARILGFLNPTSAPHAAGAASTGLQLVFFVLILATAAGLCWSLSRLSRLPVSESGASLLPRAVLLGALAGLLVHSGFDFVLQNQALLIATGLVAGLLTAGGETMSSAAATLGANPPLPPPPSPRERLRQRLPAVAVVFCAGALVWLGVLRPLRVAWAQVAADRAAQHVELLSLQPPSAAADDRRQLTAVGVALLDARRAVVELTPADHEAVLQYHEAVAHYRQLCQAAGLPEPAIDGLAGLGRSSSDELRTLAELYLAGNPVDPTRWYYAGRVYLSLGHLQDRENLQRARTAFETAAGLDPRRPLLHLMVGDCCLAQGDRPAAIRAYQRAWQAQAETSTPEVQFYCLYYDPNPEILPPAETGMDAILVDQPPLLLHGWEQLAPDDRAALLRRYWVALRAVQIAAPPLPLPRDPAHPTTSEKAAAGQRLLWTAQEKKTLDDLLTLRPGSADTRLLLTLRALTVTAAPPTDAEMARAFADLKPAATAATVDPLLPGTLERIEALVRFPPRLRYSAPPPD